jgi:hypothetical protein
MPPTDRPMQIVGRDEAFQPTRTRTIVHERVPARLALDCAPAISERRTSSSTALLDGGRLIEATDRSPSIPPQITEALPKGRPPRRRVALSASLAVRVLRYANK